MRFARVLHSMHAFAGGVACVGNQTVSERHPIAVHRVEGRIDFVLAVVVDEGTDAIGPLMEIGICGNLHQGDDLVRAIIHLPFAAPVERRAPREARRASR
jgi:hypothetical protein